MQKENELKGRVSSRCGEWEENALKGRRVVAGCVRLAMVTASKPTLSSQTPFLLLTGAPIIMPLSLDQWELYLHVRVLWYATKTTNGVKNHLTLHFSRLFALLCFSILLCFLTLALNSLCWSMEQNKALL